MKKIEKRKNYIREIRTKKVRPKMD